MSKSEGSMLAINHQDTHKQDANISIDRSDEHRLFNLCRWNRLQDIQKILSSNPGVDILHDDGIFFQFAVSKKSLQMLQTLIEYAEQHHPDGKDEALKFDYQLKHILQEARDKNYLTTEIEDFISAYLKGFDEEDDSDGSSLYYDIALGIVDGLYSKLHDSYDGLKVLLSSDSKRVVFPKIPEHIEHYNVGDIKSDCEDLSTTLRGIKEEFSEQNRGLIAEFVGHIHSFLENKVVYSVLNNCSDEEIQAAVVELEHSHIPGFGSELFGYTEGSLSPQQMEEYHKTPVLGNNGDVE